MQPPRSARVVRDFKALNGGASYRINVTPGASLPRSASAQNQFIMDLYDKGFFGQPGTPPAAKIAVELLEGVDSNKILERLDAMEEQINAQQPNPAEEQAMQQEHEQALAEQQMQAEQQKQSLIQQHEETMQEARVQADTAIAQAKAQAEIAKIHATRQAGPTVSLSGKLDASGTVSAEHQAGLEGDIASAKQMLTPPKPAITSSNITPRKAKP